MRTNLAVVVLVVVGACDSGAPSCTDAVAKAKSHGVGEQLAIVKVCEDRKWSGDIRGCLARATSNAKADECLEPVIDEVFAAQAADDAKAAMEQVEALQKELDAINTDVARAIDIVINATSDET